MNWTEGTLNRHSRGRKGKETVLRQKEHFAKARSGLLNANIQNNPPSISFLAHPPLPASLARHGPLKSTQPSPKEHNDALDYSRYFSEVNAATPNPAIFHQQKTGKEPSCQKRRKLLFKGDWVGTGVQKPIEMKFSGSRASPSHAWGARLAHHDSSRHKLRQLLGVKHDTGRNKAYQGGSTPISIRKMKIRVGSRERTLGGSSNISRSHRGDGSSFYGESETGSHDYRGNPKLRDDVSMFGSEAHTRPSSNGSGHTNQLPTSPLLFHPVPTRPALLQLLPSHSVDSEDAESIIAQVGVQQPLVPRAQVEENETWRAFVAESDEIKTSTGFHAFGNEQTAFERPGSDLPGIMGSENPSDDGQAAPAPEDPSPDLPATDLQHAFEVAQAGDRQTQRCGQMMPESSDEVSLLVIPSSPVPSSSPPTTPYYETLLQTVQPEEPVPEAFIGPAQLTGHQEFDEPSRGQGISHTVGKAQQGTPEDENDMWRKFVFGGSDGNLEQVREDARKETARNLRPSITSSSTYDEASRPNMRSYEDSHQSSTTFPSELGLGVNQHNCAQGSQHIAANFSATASASHVATAGASSPVPTSDFQYSETTVQTDQATAGSSNAHLLTQTDMMDDPMNPMATKTSSTETNSDKIEKRDESDESFRFARPKLFMGKKLAPVDEEQQIALSTAQIRGKTQTRRRRTRTGDGRANIRKLPDYGSDPIEEFEEDFRSDQAQKGSIFGSLETGENF
ncbi:hypothetical protein VM1G_09959 [Cytospora mali]|uniref:Uncharacterized protein n=1 Tax=Cytospora mali TaxID=578113 RepID=A0A194WDV4_CYTMA|nr:hypothetical protein VM1G_09959 [Valsa mali]